MPDWLAWRDAYESSTGLRDRIAIVQARIAQAADGRPDGLRVISICDVLQARA